MLWTRFNYSKLGSHQLIRSSSQQRLLSRRQFSSYPRELPRPHTLLCTILFTNPCLILLPNGIAPSIQGVSKGLRLFHNEDRRAQGHSGFRACQSHRWSGVICRYVYHMTTHPYIANVNLLKSTRRTDSLSSAKCLYSQLTPDLVKRILLFSLRRSGPYTVHFNL